MCLQHITESRVRRRLSERVHELGLLHGNIAEHVWFNLAMVAVQESDLVEAEKFFRKALSVNPNFRSALFNLGVLLYEAQRYNQSVHYLKKHVTLYPQHVKGTMLLADIYMIHLGAKSEACAVSSSLRSSNSTQQSTQRTYFEARFLLQCYREVIRWQANNSEARYNLCVLESSTDSGKADCSKYLDASNAAQLSKRALKNV